MKTISKLLLYQADWKDLALTKIAVFAGALLIAKLWQPILSLEWYWYLIISLVFTTKPLVTFLKYFKEWKEKLTLRIGKERNTTSFSKLTMSHSGELLRMLIVRMLKIAFGKIHVENGQKLLPIAIHAHHALVDGLHVGKYL